MKKAPFLLLFIAFLGCKKSDYTGTGLLVEITNPNGKSNSFEYNSSGMLTKENFYSMCTTPVDEHAYVYQNGRLEKVESKLRSFYSSTGAMCNPASGMQSVETYEYNSQGQLIKADRQTSYTMFEYNTRGNVVRQLSFQPNGTPIAGSTYTYNYDARGNMIESIDPQGSISRYEYDNKINPFYRMKQRPSFITPFTKSPNNVIKCILQSGGWERTIVEYQNDLPVRIMESGVPYDYIYR